MTMEPLVVEYLVLEKECARKSIFERFPPTWTWIRQFGFSRTKSKIEALWAFIEAHEMSMKEFPSLSQHFPEVATCMEDIITEAKRDLEILKELRPRRYFYVKHFLALRYVMNKRLSRLKRFIREGWLAPGDVEGLTHEFQKRISQVEQFIPSARLYRYYSKAARGSMLEDNFIESDAWTREEIEEDRMFNRTGRSSQSSQRDSGIIKVCPGGCGYQVTWHATHCCGRCENGNGHGPRCDRKKIDKAPPPHAESNHSGISNIFRAISSLRRTVNAMQQPNGRRSVVCDGDTIGRAPNQGGSSSTLSVPYASSGNPLAHSNNSSFGVSKEISGNTLAFAAGAFGPRGSLASESSKATFEISAGAQDPVNSSTLGKVSSVVPT